MRWLHSPAITGLPDPSHLSPTEISRVLSTLTNRGLGGPDSQVWTSAVARIVDVLTAPARTQGDVVSAIHVIDRIAAHGAVPSGLDELMDSLERSSSFHRVSKTDALMAARAGLLLGSSAGLRFLTPAHCKTLSTASLIQVASLMRDRSTAECNQHVIDQIGIRIAKDVNALSTADLLLAVQALVSSGTLTSTKVLKLAGSEVARRVELGCVSPRLAGLIVELFSGLPPNPIHPMALQAGYARLLQDWDYRRLSRSELARILHAMGLSEIENLVLTRSIVKRLAAVSRCEVSEDPRIGLRAVSAVSILKSFIPKSYVHALTCGAGTRVVNPDDISMLVTALVNLVGSGGVCPSTVAAVAENADFRRCDLVDAASLMLLIGASRAMAPNGCTACACTISPSLPAIPAAALELTEKANAAMPNKDVKKKRQAKRVQARGESLFDSLDSDWGVPTTLGDCTPCMPQVSLDSRIIGRLVSRCHSEVIDHSGLHASEVQDACTDILTGLALMDNIGDLDPEVLRGVLALTDACLAVLANAKPMTATADTDTEDSVFRTVAAMGLTGMESPSRTNSNITISLVISA